MIKKIQDFGLDAERHAETTLGFCGHPDYIKVRNEKFAELVVKECLSLIEGQKCHPGVSRDDKYGSFFKGHDQAIKDCTWAISNGFKVK